jgi:ketosteroid isomerase-like protein
VALVSQRAPAAAWARREDAFELEGVMSGVAVGSQGNNLEIIFVDWLDAMRRHDLDRLSARLAPDVVHEGVRADRVCRGRDAVVERLRARGAQLPRVSAIELVEAGERVVMSVRAPTVGAPVEDDGPQRGQATIVFTLRDGLIVRMQDYLSRAEALAALGRTSDDVWQ